jgi:hypothetical protein
MLMLACKLAQSQPKRNKTFQPPNLAKKGHGHARTGPHMRKQKQFLASNQLKQRWDILGEIKSILVTQRAESAIKQK